MKPIRILRWLALAALLASAQAAAQVAKVVWHVDFADARRLSAMIQNVNNMVMTYQSNLEDYDVRVVFIAGGIVPDLVDALASSAFRERFEDKGRFRAYLSPIPTFVITRELPAFLGLTALLDANEEAGGRS